mmetsp:Transcript_100401/g.158827  ORF Transcript_100401/g.158827 Transcript_100401/m.158827 type:complete len:296 (+) Transcript_100401:1-888(+)
MQVCSWFQMDTEQAKPTEEFFSIWDDFLDNVKKALEKINKPTPRSQPLVKRRQSSGSALPTDNSPSGPRQSRSSVLRPSISRRPTTPRKRTGRSLSEDIPKELIEKGEAERPEPELKSEERGYLEHKPRTHHTAHFEMAARMVEDSFKKAELLKKVAEAAEAARAQEAEDIEEEKERRLNDNTRMNEESRPKAGHLEEETLKQLAPDRIAELANNWAEKAIDEESQLQLHEQAQSRSHHNLNHTHDHMTKKHNHIHNHHHKLMKESRQEESEIGGKTSKEEKAVRKVEEHEDDWL